MVECYKNAACLQHKLDFISQSKIHHEFIHSDDACLIAITTTREQTDYTGALQRLTLTAVSQSPQKPCTSSCQMNAAPESADRNSLCMSDEPQIWRREKKNKSEKLKNE